MIRLEMLPAQHGDALLLEYGPGDEAVHRVVIDAGPDNAYRDVRGRFLRLPADGHGVRHCELLVVTHVDGDHIEGVVKGVQDEELGLRPADVWFNDWNHLANLEAQAARRVLGPEAGEFLGALLDEEALSWNAAFAGDAVVVPSNPDAGLQAHTLPGGMLLTVISPTFDTLVRLRKAWKSAITAAGFRPGDRKAAIEQFRNRRWAKVTLGHEGQSKTLDHSQANGSSIALIAEYGGRRLLLAGDAFAPELRQGIERFQLERGQPGQPIELDAFKLAHHGSDKNITPELLRVMSCSTYLVSTNGKRFYHPDKQALEHVVAEHRGSSRPALLFNYETSYTKPWGQRDDCEATYGAVLELTTDESK